MRINSIKFYSSFAITLLFFSLSFWFIHFHEMWADELHTWTFTRDVSSFSAFFYSLKYGGHPSLWYLIVYPFSKIFSDPASMQYLHIVISSFNIYILNRYSPFDFYKKIFLTFGYFFFYEYSLISRNYSLTILLIFIISALISIKSSSKLLISFLIFLLCHSHVFGIAFALAFLFYFISEMYFEKKIKITSKKKKITIFFSILLILIGIITSAFTVIQPNDSPLESNWHFYLSLDRYMSVIKSYASGYIPIPKLQFEFWNSIIIIDKNHQSIGIIIFSVLFIFILTLIISFLNKPSVLIFFLTSTFGLFFLFIYTKYLGAIRHSGFFFISFLVAMWIKKNSSSSNSINLYEKHCKLYIDNFINFFFFILCFFHFIATILPVYLDYKFPFSGARETAEFIKKENLEKSDIIAYPTFNTSSVVGYLNNKKVLYLEGDSYGSYYTFDGKMNNKSLDFNQKLLELSTYKKNLIILLNFRISEDLAKKINLVQIFKSKNSIIKDETFFLYVFSE